MKRRIQSPQFRRYSGRTESRSGLKLRAVDTDTPTGAFGMRGYPAADPGRT